MKTVFPFKSVFAYEYLNLDLDLIKKECQYIVEQSPSRTFSNRGGYQSHDLQFTTKGLIDMEKNITKKVKLFAKKILELQNNIKLDNIWLNINKYKDYNVDHEHPGSIVSGVFYISVPKNSGEIAFIGNTKIYSYLNHKNYNINFNNCATYKVPVENNKLILFPSWLVHRVEPNFSNEDRISFSFNYS